VTERIDWRLPENRQEAFWRFYSFHLRYRTHPGLVYMWLPAIAEAYDLDDDQKAWLVWLNGNTQNPVTSLLLLEAAPHPKRWSDAVDFWNANFKALEWDTDRRHQKSKFGEATERWASPNRMSADGWLDAGMIGWDATWKYASSQPYMGRLSAWSMTEYARILFGEDVPDAATFMLEDLKGSNSHRNGVCVTMGYDAAHWKADDPGQYPSTAVMNVQAEALLAEARVRDAGQDWAGDITRLTMESALCTYKSWHKPNRRYPNVYADMAYYRLKRAEARFGKRFKLLWDTRAERLPDHLLLERSPQDPGLCAAKQNHYLNTGEVIMMDQLWPDMANGFNDAIARGFFGDRKDRL
jgi:hypothetical protein